MKDFLKKAIVTIASFITFIAGEAAYCGSVDNCIKDFKQCIRSDSERHFYTKISDYFSSKATLVNLGHSHNAEPLINSQDWTSDNYTNRPSVSLNDFYVDTEIRGFSGGLGIKTFPERDGLVSALKDIEYQFFPVDARNPLKLAWIGVPGIWGKVNFSKNSYFQIIWYETHWSKITPEAVPELMQKKMDNPNGEPGTSLFTSFGTRLNDLSFEVGISRGWSSWPNKEKEKTSNFSPNPYKYTSAYFKFREYFDTWNIAGTALVKHSEEKAGSIFNLQTSIDKELSLWNKPVKIGTSFFFVQSFLQSNHLRTSPWEDLGNSISFWAYIEDKKLKHRFGIEQVLNPEEFGIYVTGFTEKWISDLFKTRTQMDFFYDKQKHISEQYDSFRFSFHGIITF